MARHTGAIPIAVARAVKQSAWFATQKNNENADWVTKQALADFESAALGGWRRNVLVHSSGHAQAMVDGASATFDELSVPGKKESALQQALAACAQAMRRNVELMLDEEKVEAAAQAAEEAKEAEKLKAEAQRSSVEFWEKPMATIIEAKWVTTRNAITSEYGLDSKDPRVRAALTAAFRAGARESVSAAHSLVYSDPHVYEAEEVEKLHQRNITMFAKARQRKNQENKEA